MTKITNFPYLWPDKKCDNLFMTLINILFQTCLITNSLVQTNVNLNFIIYMNVELPSNFWMAFVDGLVNNDKKGSFFINSYLIQDLECKSLPLFYFNRPFS